MYSNKWNMKVPVSFIRLVVSPALNYKLTKGYKIKDTFDKEYMFEAPHFCQFYKAF